MASIRTLKTGYQVRWREGGRESPLLHSQVLPTKAAALALKGRIEAQLAAKKSTHGPAILPLPEVVERWAVSRVARGNNPLWTRNSADRLQTLITRAGWPNTLAITPVSIERWRAGAYSTRLGSVLSGALRWARDYLDQPVDEKALIAMRPGRQTQELRELVSESTVHKWLEDSKAVSPGFHALLHCLSLYGWRPITAKKLLISDLNLERGVVTLRDLKGGNSLRHALATSTLSLLRPLVEQRSPAEAVFLNPLTGLPYVARGGQDIPAVFYRWAGRNLGIYELKRYAISRMLERGLAPQTVAGFTGHKTLSQVLRYARTNEEKTREALAILGA